MSLDSANAAIRRLRYLIRNSNTELKNVRAIITEHFSKDYVITSSTLERLINVQYAVAHWTKVARVLDHAQPQRLTRQGTASRLALARDPNAAPLERLAGVLVAGTARGPVAVAVDVALARGAARTSLNQEGGS